MKLFLLLLKYLMVMFNALAEPHIRIDRGVNHTRASISSLRSFIDFRCSNEMQANLLQQVTTEEIPNCLFSMPLDKSPGSDGFPADFYRLTWDIVGPDFVVQTKRKNANQILVIKGPI